MPQYNTISWGTAPSTTCLKLWEFADPTAFKDVLVLGVGDGKNAMFLAEQGFNVTGIDDSDGPLDRLVGWANKSGFSMRVIKTSFEQIALDLEFDIVVSVGVAHLVPPKIRQDWFELLDKATRPGGFHAMSAFVSKPFLEECQEGFYKSGELLYYYAPYKVHWSTQELFKGQSGQVLCVDRVIAQKLVSTTISPDEISQNVGLV